MRLTLTLSFLALLAAGCIGANTSRHTPNNSYDVIVYGATPGGVLAAVAAAREGQSVLLVEPLPLVGGIISGGMGFSDSNQMYRESMGGLFKEFYRRIEKDYEDRGVELPYKVDDTNGVPWTWEPHVAERVFEAMLDEVGVDVVLQEHLTGADMDGVSIRSIRTHTGKTYSGRMFIDGTYEGDLLAAARVPYRVGREGRDEFGESLAGARYPKDAVDNVSALDAQGRLLPLMSGRALTPEGQGDRGVMVYSFRLMLSDQPDNRVPFTRPADYDPARYELLRRFYQANPDYRIAFDMYPVPGNKLDGNNSIGGQISLGLVGENWDYPEADYRRRQAMWEDHKSYTEGFLYFLTTDPAVPEKIRDRMQQLGYAKDEFAEYGHFPPVLYVREGRRMEGAYMITQADVLEKREKPDPVGVASFPIDSHDVQRILTRNGGFINEGTIFPDETRVNKLGIAYHVPYRSIIPAAGSCDNLLVPVAMSSSHVAMSSIRVEPTWMVLGESAGIAAAVALEEGVPVQNVDQRLLRERLEARGQILKLPN